jgi:hypothetical protein
VNTVAPQPRIHMIAQLVAGLQLLADTCARHGRPIRQCHNTAAGCVPHLVAAPLRRGARLDRPIRVLTVAQAPADADATFGDIVAEGQRMRWMC